MVCTLLSFVFSLIYQTLGFATITSTTALSAKASLHMPTSLLMLTGVITTASGILESQVWSHIQHGSRLSDLTILIHPIPLAFLIQHQIVLSTPDEIFALTVIFGSVHGCFQGYARAFYAELVRMREGM
ncbi:hypothetical protein P691DRAFT_533773 [Macrolepiota fuliginosa MF-IS2]|uniref:Autophagy-related protein n=1 Tax=Macrolepiota fuliginosa MF-IS2 TaxID=1400762 RepID=A0A9P6BXV8_9AGAR|nr:hypothetical protein P691DRAFT_533773 [Macrolepiota fuliginosa MF-IS2]